jgi:glycosyltransferase involved in cell wall biosynthesis
MMKLPKVTVLVTCKNSIRTIQKCVESLLDLKYPHFKILFVDAFSTDGTYEVLKKYADKKKIILKQLKGNPPTAYNYALRMIKTEFTAITNADCVADRNWLRELIKPFKENDVMAVAGLVKNPRRPTSKLQEIIGRELADRYKHFSREMSRAPEMNLCLRTSIARKLRFDRSLDVSYDTDFGNRLRRKYGRILYQKSAIIYHYHRATWKGLFKQQLKYGKFVPKVYLKNRTAKITGDKISKFSMMLQIVFIYLGVLFSVISLFSSSFYSAAILMFLLLLITYLIDIVKLSRTLNDAFWFLSLFVVRNIAWSIGIAIGIIKNL